MTIRALGWTHVLLGGAGLLSGTVLFLVLGFSGQQVGHRIVVALLPWFVLLAAVYLVPALVGGIGLLRGRAWARSVIGVLSALLVPVVPIGTVLGGLGLWALFGREDSPPFGPFPTIDLAAVRNWLLIVGAALGTLAAIVGAGYLLGDRLPRPPSNRLERGFLILIGGVLTFGVLKLFEGEGLARFSWGRLRSRRAALRRQQEVEAAHRARIAALAADPVRRRYAEGMERGEYWSDEQIAYDLDPERTATCVHLAPLERVMRRAVGVRWSADGHVEADCRVDLVRLAAVFPLPASVEYRMDLYAGGRFPTDPTDAGLLCAPCGSGIRLAHPQHARPETPWFPPAGGVA